MYLTILNTTILLNRFGAIYQVWVILYCIKVTKLPRKALKAFLFGIPVYLPSTTTLKAGINQPLY